MGYELDDEMRDMLFEKQFDSCYPETEVSYLLLDGGTFTVKDDVQSSQQDFFILHYGL